MSAPIRICVVGSANVDLTFRTPRLPRAGETLTGRDFQIGFGGKGANQAVMAARLGAHVSLVASVGNDSFGQDYLRHLRAHGIDVTHIQVDPTLSTGTAAIIVDDDARNCILVVPGANAGLTPDQARSALPALRSARCVLGQFEVPRDTIQAAFREARAAGARTILNPAPALDISDDLLRLTDVCIPNETELEALTGQPTETLEEVISAALILQKRGAREVIATLGDRGVVVLSETEAVHVPALAVAAVDPTGAGDTFIGSLAVFWGEGQSLLGAARRANMVAALTVTRPGAQTAMPTRTEAEAFLSQTQG